MKTQTVIWLAIIGGFFGLIYLNMNVREERVREVLSIFIFVAAGAVIAARHWYDQTKRKE